MSLEYFLGSRQTGKCRRPFEDFVRALAKRDLGIGVHGHYIPCSIVDGRRVKIHEFMAFMLHYYCPRNRVCRVLDPTCGKENHQFSRLKPYMAENGIEYVDGDIRPYGSYQGSVFKLPFRDGCFDVVVYDPPYLVLPGNCRDDRRHDYGLDDVLTLSDVKKYYSREAINELARVTRENGVVIVKGADFYHPVTSRNLVLFFVDVFNPRIYDGLMPEALYIYMYYRQQSFRITRVRMKDIQRPLIIHTYYVVMRKTG